MNCLETPIVKFTDLKIDTPVVAEALGLTPPAPQKQCYMQGSRYPDIPEIYPADYFLTVAFPVNCRFKIKHLQLEAQGRSKIVFSEIKYGDCTQEEQYRWIMHCMTKSMRQISDYYDVFFEFTKTGNIHLHARLGYEGRKKSMKDIKTLIHRMFECSTQYTRFVDIKKYDDTKWNDYAVKYKKTYQTTHYPHFNNIIEEVEGESHESIRESE